mgnify:CR=1 FL=1
MLIVGKQIAGLSEVCSHPFLKVVLGVTNVDFVGQFAFHLVDYNWVPANVVVATLSIDFTQGVAVAIEGFKVFGQYILSELP